MRAAGMRRFSNSLFMHGRSRPNKPQHKTTTDFFTSMNAEHHRYGTRCIYARQPMTPFILPLSVTRNVRFGFLREMFAP